MNLSNIEYEIIREYDTLPEKRIENWEIAIGLNKVDGLEPSNYLITLTKDSIEGRKTFSQIEENIKSYYSKMDNKDINYHEMECDLVSTRIASILEDGGFVFSPIQLKDFHYKLFHDAFTGELKDTVGEYRDYNIRKNENILKGKSVVYGDYSTIDKVLSFDFQQEKNKKYSLMSREKQIKSIANFTSAIWQVHPFSEGNTRTIALFIGKYLIGLGYSINNDLFKENSLYFRNALVASNFSSIPEGISPNYKYLEDFFMKLLYDKDLKLCDIEIFKD